jgi:hypothetical protein
LPQMLVHIVIGHSAPFSSSDNGAARAGNLAPTRRDVAS